MASKSKKKDKKKSKKNDKIELEEVDETSLTASSSAAATEETANSTLLVLPGEVAASSTEILDLNQKPGSKVKVLPALDGHDDKTYEEAVSAALNSPDLDGYELLSVLQSADEKKLIAFFRLSK